MKSFQNKVAAITGAASGMGRTLAVELARRGCHLALSDVNEAELVKTAELASAHGVKVTVKKVNVAERDAVFAWANEAARDHGRVNLVFNNAGVALTANVEDVKITDFEWIMGINFWGVVHGTQAFLPHLKASGDGHIVNTSSLFGLMAVPTQGTYNASKFAVRGYTEALRMELEMEGACVSATCVHPGGIATNIAMAGKIDASVTAKTGVSEADHKRAANKLINVTTAESAALQILKAVEHNERRVLVGPDARFLDKMVRLLGSAYQVLVMRQVRKMNSARSHRAAAATR
ncbi:short-subunit dehydrogenase [Aquabacterium commune]|uniref:Short-subunit dehydrogenase n=1 Tax=Aquabacterium commune TaxID=70586 RepID=A0A4R6RNP6_9BURK|nr:SDR family NAD(P)-dependent oxidoreductase [Aquabacterium commune]TDP88359.1 short-subunit dehydrogenase [Aquabacterium commune]